MDGLTKHDFKIKEQSVLKINVYVLIIIFLYQIIWNHRYEIHYEKSRMSKSHYTITKTKKENSYTTIVQLSLSYYN